jgi:hypothetical protein
LIANVIWQCNPARLQTRILWPLQSRRMHRHHAREAVAGALMASEALIIWVDAVHLALDHVLGEMNQRLLGAVILQFAKRPQEAQIEQ